MPYRQPYQLLREPTTSNHTASINQIHSPNITEEHAQLLSKRANIGYINSRPNDATDTAHLTQLNVAWLDSLNLADAAIESLLRRNLRDDIIFNRYFNGNDAAQHANVVNVFRAIAGPNGNGGPGFAHVQFNNVLNNQPVPPGNGVVPTLCLDPAFPTIGADTINNGAWNPNVLAYITVCGRGYNKLSASEVRARFNPCARTEIFPE